MNIFFFLVSFLSSIIGSICGIGGGIIIKPVLDMLGAASVSTISFLAGCTVLAMSCYNVSANLISKKGGIETATGTPLAIGAALGGIVGKQVFQIIKAATGKDGVVGAVQSALLLLLVVGTLIYTLKKSGIRTKSITSKLVCAAIGLALGFFSSFLGIGGGPFNLVVFHYFLSMDTKKAAANSLYVILFSQISSLLMTLIKGSVPPFELGMLLFMVIGGVGGGIVGKKLTARLSLKSVDKLFIGLLGLIILICTYNLFRYLSM